MPVLSNHRHELFAQSLAGGLNATEAYVAAGYERSGARQNVSRLLQRPDIVARVQELQSSTAAGVIRPEITQRDARMQALQDRHNHLSRIMDARSKDETMADVPGGTTGLLVRHFRGRNADVPVYLVDYALLDEMLAIERQAAELLGQLGERRKRGR